MSGEALQELTDRLEQTAARLRVGELDPRQAAVLVQLGARLAGEAATELDRQVRAAADAPATAPSADRPSADRPSADRAPADRSPGQGDLLAP